MVVLFLIKIIWKDKVYKLLNSKCSSIYQVNVAYNKMYFGCERQTTGKSSRQKDLFCKTAKSGIPECMEK